MKIGIITSGSETLTLFRFLSKYDHEYLVYYDFLHWPYGDKTFEQGLACVEKGIEYFTKQGVDAIILPPVYELHYLVEGSKIFPLFRTYLFEYCFKYSLVGKIGLFGDFADVEQAQSLVKKLATTYILTENQKKIKKFHYPFAYRTKETPLWKYYLSSLSYSNVLVNKIIKFDLSYFKDAMTDTVIPLNYGYFHYQTTITKFLNFKKIRFHGLEKLETIFQTVTSDKGKVTSKYSITIAYTGHVELLKREKRLVRLLQRGKNIDIVFKKV
ncbi:MAG: hypothetical protein NTY80_03555 [candidate division SR1 bacterium]|nr:hypothetical protein [candidate division SR1 bacterium]